MELTDEYRRIRDKFEHYGLPFENIDYEILKQFQSVKSISQVAKELHVNYYKVYRRTHNLELMGAIRRQREKGPKGVLLYLTDWEMKGEPTFYFTTKYLTKNMNLQDLGAYLWESQSLMVHAIRYSGSLIAHLKNRENQPEHELSLIEARACLLGLSKFISDYLSCIKEVLEKPELWNDETLPIYIGPFEEDWAPLVAHTFERAYKEGRLGTKGFKGHAIQSFLDLLDVLPYNQVMEIKNEE